ncbi:MAG: 5-dehydro-2-deoxygluconokinase [Betaproteobacteria bacterium]|nr:5-dehydro-2-deoxygluconokinase [Betaproteobacteria bacterium]
MGRAAVDLYGEQIGARLEDQASFAKYLGGSPANTGVAASRLGLKVAALTRVGDEHNGRFVRETLAAEGVDVSHVRTDPDRLTALVFLAIRDRATFPLVFYRHDCADMAIAPEDFDAAFIGSARALLVSGTHFSREQISKTCFAAIAAAKKQNVKVVFDIDFRPVLWGLAPPGRGEDRFVKSKDVTARMQQVIPLAELVIGTEEEFHIAAGTEDTGAALARLQQLGRAVLVVKRGALGCSVADGPRLIDAPGFAVEVYNILGAGDGFAGGFLSGWLRARPLEECARFANACGALVVSRHGCAPAMPSKEELELFLSRDDWPFRLRESALLNDIHRRTANRKPWPEVMALAFDHRKQLEKLGAPERIRAFKRLVAQGARRGAAGTPGAGAIVDERYGEEALFELNGTGMWLARPVELPGSAPLEFEAGANVGLALRGWPREHVVKCLCSFSSEDIPKLKMLCEACVETGHELLLEIIAGDLPGALRQIYAAGIKPDWWKLAPPSSDAAWMELGALIRKHDPHCRGVLLLGMEASDEELERSFSLAARHPLCKGFAVGRSIFMDAARRWFRGECSDADVVAEVSANYARLIGTWKTARTTCNESVS